MHMQQQRQMPPQMMQQIPPQMYQMQQNPVQMGYQMNINPALSMGLPGQQFNEQLQNLSLQQTRSAPVSKEEKNKFPSLYVSNLPKDFFDLDFYKLITSQGFKLKSAKVVLHKKTSKPLGYGYLQFNSKDEAERCLKAMNNYVLNGQALRIVHSVPKFEYNAKANLLVKNLDKDVSQQELYETFRQFGDIQSCKLETYADGSSKGYAYIQFQSEEVAEVAMERMQGQDLRGRKLEINKHEKKSTRETKDGSFAPAKFNNLFVKNLPKGTDDAQLKDLFAKFGEIESVQVQRDEQGNLKDYGYVCFKDSANAEAAVEEMNKKQISEDQFLIVNKHISKKEFEPSHGSRLNPITQNLSKTFNSNIFIKFIPNYVTEDELRKTFTIKDSNIISIKLNKFVTKIDDTELQPYQFAYILYDTVQGAQKAIQTYDQSTVFGSKPLLVELWVSKEEKEQERKRKENHQVSQFLNNILNLSRANSYPPQNQQPGMGPMGQAPHGQMQQNQYNQGRGQGQNRRFQQNKGGPRGGHRGGHPGPQGGHQQFVQRQQPGPMPGQFPSQQFQQQVAPQPFGMMPGQYPPQPMPQQYPPVQLLPLPTVNMQEFQSIQDANERRNFVGNNVYQIIQNAFGQDHAGKITGMLIDENAVNFTQLLTDPSYFTLKATEALTLLKRAAQQQQQPQVQVDPSQVPPQ